jgi:hypothetical protein
MAMILITTYNDGIETKTSCLSQKQACDSARTRASRADVRATRVEKVNKVSTKIIAEYVNVNGMATCVKVPEC